MRRPGKPSLGGWLAIGYATVWLGTGISWMAGDGTVVGIEVNFAEAFVLSCVLWWLLALCGPRRVIPDENPPAST